MTEHRSLVPNALLPALAVSQAIFFLLGQASPERRAVGIALGALVCVEAWAPWLFAGRRNLGMWLLSGLIAVNFGAHLVSVTPPFSLRLLQVAIVLGYATVALGGVTTLIWEKWSKVAAGGAAVTASLLLIGEGILGRAMPADPADSARWEAVASDTASSVPEVNAPGALLRALYPDDPEGYFDDPRAFQATWHLDQHGEEGNATLAFPSGLVRSARVQVVDSLDGTPWRVQLNGGPLNLKTGEEYELSFRARADRSRRIIVGLAQGHDPWNGLGYSRDIPIDGNWRSFSERLTLASGDTNGRLHFDLASSPGTVDIAGITLRRLSTGTRVDAVMPTVRQVQYRFNSVGCRGREYASSRASTVQRVLLIGGTSFALGIGLHEEDTFAARLEQFLNDSAARRSEAPTFEVINCTTPRTEALHTAAFFERAIPRYAPDVVLLAVSPSDALDLEGPSHIARGALADLFFTWRWMHEAHDARTRLSTEVDRARAGASDVKARLAIVVLGRASDSEQHALARSASTPVGGLGVSLLTLDDLGLKARSPTPSSRGPGPAVMRTAHEYAAREIARMLCAEQLFSPSGTNTQGPHRE